MEPALKRLYDNVTRVVIGKSEAVRLAVTAIVARGHVLIDDAPGLGKTLLARALAQSIDADFRRIQFTPDLLPADVTGVSIFNPGDRTFEFRRGPVFTNVLLADEINRTSPRTQSSLLEAMEERQVTAEGTTYRLEEPFFVVATLNPIELQGTFPLPEAQIDRFLMRLELGYPSPDEEMQILATHVLEEPIRSVTPVIGVKDLLDLQARARRVVVSEAIRRYIVTLSHKSRRHPAVRLGLSPRGSLALMRAAQAYSLFLGLGFVSPDAVKAIARPVMTHRLFVDPEREALGQARGALVDEILETTPVPTLPDAAYALEPRA